MAFVETALRSSNLLESIDRLKGMVMRTRQNEKPAQVAHPVPMHSGLEATLSPVEVKEWDNLAVLRAALYERD